MPRTIRDYCQIIRGLNEREAYLTRWIESSPNADNQARHIELDNLRQRRSEVLGRFQDAIVAGKTYQELKKLDIPAEVERLQSEYEASLGQP
jgi:hypothetical protein